jgi:acetyl esterase/lipase
MKRIALVLFATFAVVAAHAATLNWTGAVDNRWSTPGNWSPAQVPQSGDVLKFNNSTNPAMVNDLPAGTVLQSLTFFVSPAVPFTVSGSTIEVSSFIDGLSTTTINADVRAMGPLSLSFNSLTFGGGFDVNGKLVSVHGGVDFRGPVTGSGMINTSGGSGRFYAPSTFSGTIFTPSGTACVGSASVFADFSSAVIDNGCAFFGSGTIGTTLSSGTLSPESVTGGTAILRTGNLTLSNRNANVDGARPFTPNLHGTTPGSGYDQVKVTGTVTLNGGFIGIAVDNGFVPAIGDTFIVIDNDGTDPISGLFNTPCFGCAGTPIPEGSTITNGGYSFRISYHGGDGNDVAVTAIATTTTSVVTAPSTTYYGQGTTATATVNTSSGTATGSVTFTGGAVVPLVNGQATYNVPASVLQFVPTTQISASYSGDATHGPSSGTTSQNVLRNDTTTSMSASPNPAAAGQDVTLTSMTTRTTGTGGPVSNSGAITFEDNGVDLNTPAIPTSNGVATFHTSSLAPGDHSIRAHYANQLYENNSISPFYTVRILQTSTTTANAIAAATADGATVSVHVAGFAGGPTPSGTVTVRNGAATLGSATLDNNGNATVSIAGLAAGTYSLNVSYSGDATYGASSTNVTVTVGSITFLASNVSVPEGDSGTSQAIVAVRLSGVSTQTITVDYETVDRSATAGEDYVRTSGRLTFAPGEVRKTIAVTINGDTTPEPNETFSIRLSNPQNAVITDGLIDVTIANDDSTVSTVVRDVVYATVDGQALRLDLFLPIYGGVHPVIVGIDAPNWNSPQQHSSIISREADRGYVVALLSFRTAATAPMPAQIRDVKAAIRWLRANATQYNIDPSRIGIWGIGAGGHLAALSGTTNGNALFDDASLGNIAFGSNVRAVVDWYGPADLGRLATDPALCAPSTASEITQLLGCNPATCPDTARQASPLTYASRDDAAFLIVHGRLDCTVPISQSIALHEALHNAGANSTLIILEDAAHGGAAWDASGIAGEVEDFFDRTLSPSVPRTRRARH